MPWLIVGRNARHALCELTERDQLCLSKIVVTDPATTTRWESALISSVISIVSAIDFDGGASSKGCGLAVVCPDALSSPSLSLPQLTAPCPSGPPPAQLRKLATRLIASMLMSRRSARLVTLDLCLRSSLTFGGRSSDPPRLPPSGDACDDARKLVPNGRCECAWRDPTG